MLTTIVFLPLAGALIIAFFLREARHIRLLAATVTILELGLALVTFVIFREEDYRKVGGMEFVELYENWIPALNIQYHLGIDGLSAPLVLLSAILGMCAVFVSWNVQLRVKEYFMWLLILQAAVMGVFLSLDLILFFVFWESMLIPMYLLIGVWGGQRRIYATVKFVLYTMAGSALMLVGILYLYFENGNSFDLMTLYDKAGALPHQRLLFLAFFIAFAIKIPVAPLHTWLPDAHVEAPTPISMILAGILLKMGGYGIIRICYPICPEAGYDLAYFVCGVGVFSMVYGAFAALAQTDFKRLVAYSSVSHMGYVVLGLGVWCAG